MPIVRRVFELLDTNIVLTCHVQEGGLALKGDIVAKISGPARQILTEERVALNFLQHLSGIATKTNEAAASIAQTKAIIADTRKTTPGLRILEKYAVRKYVSD